MSLSMNDVLQYLASSGAEEEAKKQFGLSGKSSISQDLQVRSIRETLAEKQKAKQDEFMQKLVRQANLVNVDVLEQERQLAELEAMERQLREEQLAFELEKKAIAEEVERLDKQQTESLIEAQREELLFLQRKKLELEQAAKEKEQSVRLMTEKLEQEERQRRQEQQERDRRFKERIQPNKSNILTDSHDSMVNTAEKIAQARAEARSIQDELDAVTKQAQQLKDPHYFLMPKNSTQQEPPVSDPDLERVEMEILEMKSKWKQSDRHRGAQSRSNTSSTTSIMGLQAEDSLQQFVDRWLEGDGTASINVSAPDSEHNDAVKATPEPQQLSNSGRLSDAGSPAAQSEATPQVPHVRALDDRDALVQLVQSLKNELEELRKHQNSTATPHHPYPEHHHQQHERPGHGGFQHDGRVPSASHHPNGPSLLGYPPNPFAMPPHPHTMWQWPYGLSSAMPVPPSLPPQMPPVASSHQPADVRPPSASAAGGAGNGGKPATSGDVHRDQGLPTHPEHRRKDPSSPEQRWRKSAPTQALLRLEQQHREQMTKMEFEMEKLDRQQQLQELRQRLERDKHARQQEEEHQKWLLKQKRELQTLRVQQALQRERQILERSMQHGEAALPSQSAVTIALEEKWNKAGVFRPHMEWEPGQGVAAFVDGVSFSNTSITEVAKLRLSAGILQATVGQAQVAYLVRTSACSWMDTSSAGMLRDRFWLDTALRKETDKVNQVQGQRAFLAIEVQGIVDAQQEHQKAAVAWSYITPLVNNSLRVGCWKAKLLAGGVNPTTLTTSTAVAPDPPTAAELGYVYFRLVGVADAARATQYIPATLADESTYLEFGRENSPFDDSAAAAVAPQTRRQDSVASPEHQAPSAASASSLVQPPASRPPSSQYSFRMESRQRPQAQSRAAQDALRRVPSSQLFEDLDTRKAGPGAGAESEHWLPGLINPGAGNTYENGDAVDVYVDCARFLPDSCTVTRVVVKALTSDAELVGQVSMCFSPLSSSAVSPSYSLRMELREHVFNMTTTLLLRIDTLEVTQLQPVCVGYAALKLFVDADNAQPAESGAQGCSFNEGNFQLPLTAMRPSLVDFCEQSVQSLPRLPCSSLLVRIVCAPKTADGLSVLSRADVPERQWRAVGLDKPAPRYADGQYDGSLCAPSPEEVFAYATKSASDIFSATVENRVRQRLAELDAPDALSMSMKALEDVIHGRFPAHDDMRGVMPPTFVAEYNQQAGLRVAVDALSKLPDVGVLSKGYLLKVIYSLAPPALYYRQPPLTEGVQFTRSIDPDQPWRTPAFRDGFHTFSQLALDGSSCVVFDVRQIKYDKKGVQVEAPDRKRGFWGMFPIMTSLFGRDDNVHEKRYVASGLYQLPLVEGTVQPDIVQHDAPWQEFLRRLALRRSADGALKLAEGVSVLVRIVDSQIAGLYQTHYTDISAHEVNTTILQEIIGAVNQSSSIRAEKYALERANSGKPISSIFAKDEDVKKALKEVNKAFAEATGINHYVF